MGSQLQSRRYRASEAVDSELGYLYLFLFLCLGSLIRPTDYGHTHQRAYRGAWNFKQGPSGIPGIANPGGINLDQREGEVIAPAIFASNYSVDFKILPSSLTELRFAYLPHEHSMENNSEGLRTLFDIWRSDFYDRLWTPCSDFTELPQWTHPQVLLRSGHVLSEYDPRIRPWFMDGGMKQFEMVIDYKIPKGTSTESSLNLPSSAIRLDSIPKLLLTLLRDEAIEIMGIIKELCYIDEYSNDIVAVLYDIGLSPDNDFELRTISVILAGIIIFVVMLIMSRKRIRTVILLKSNNELDELILDESDLDESYLDDQILYENLLKEAELISSQGSSGEVFKVRFLGLECAMKVFHSYARMDFRKESVTLLNLSHPHVVKFFCSFRKSFVIMELMDEDLYSFITKIRERRIDYDMPLEVALDVMLQIAEGMSYLHHQGIAHQDLKSLNILLKLRGEFDAPDFQIIAKVADLGSARRFDPRYPEGFVLVPNMNIGTRSWRAPELFHPRGSSWARFFGINPRVLPKPLDIYGFAVICSELLTKQVPFSNDQDLRVAVLGSKVREGHRPALPPNGCPEGLLTLIKDCWHGDPVLRPEFHEVCTRLTEVRSWMSRGRSAES